MRNERKSTAVVAHFIRRADVAAARRGEQVATVCGSTTSGVPEGSPPICQACVLAQLGTDDTNHAEALVRQQVAAREQGQREVRQVARAEVMREIREAAEARAAENKQPA